MSKPPINKIYGVSCEQSVSCRVEACAGKASDCCGPCRRRPVVLQLARAMEKRRRNRKESCRDGWARIEGSVVPFLGGCRLPGADSAAIERNVPHLGRRFNINMQAAENRTPTSTAVRKINPVFGTYSGIKVSLYICPSRIYTYSKL